MKVLLTGPAGQLGHALRQQVPAGVELIASSRSGGDWVLALDLADASACRAMVRQLQPDWVLNSGAYTAVDKAESEPELAHAVNGGAPRAFAEALAETGGRLLQVSTDFVFNGSQGLPYRPEQPRDPLGIYGASKAAGEEAVEHVLGPSGRCLHRDKPGIERASSQPGAFGPILHWSDAGAASGYDVAVTVSELSLELGLLEQMAVVKPITTARRPIARGGFLAMSLILYWLYISAEVLNKASRYWLLCTPRPRSKIWVTGNWRLTFAFRDGHVFDLDFEDYH